MLPYSLQGLATRWLANLPGRAFHPLNYTTLPGRTFTLPLNDLQENLISGNEIIKKIPEIHHHLSLTNTRKVIKNIGSGGYSFLDRRVLLGFCRQDM